MTISETNRQKTQVYQNRVRTALIHDFGAVLRAGGQGDGDEDGLDRSEQIRLIEAEATRLGRLFDGLERARKSAGNTI